MNTTPSRRPVGIAIAIVFLTIAAALTAATLTLGGWWHASWPATAVLALLGAAGLAMDTTKRPRDEKGRTIREGNR